MKLLKRIKYYLATAMVLVFLSCEKDSKLETEIAKIDASFVIERFDKFFAKAEPENLPSLKAAFPLLFPQHISDSIWVNKLNDTLQTELENEVLNKFSKLTTEKDDLKRLFQHIKYYDTSFNVPRVITLANNVNHRNMLVVKDSLLLLDLANFLGEDHKFYQNLPKYISANMRPTQIVTHIAESYAKNYVAQFNRKTFLDEMIYFGKLLYFKDVITPFVSDAEKIGYTQEQLKWAIANESPIWSYFIEKELLYSTDTKLPNRFIANAPYSKFYLELDNESPGRLGQYIGWQIVKAYAENTGESVIRVLQKEPEEIFNKSKFKPRK